MVCFVSHEKSKEKKNCYSFFSCPLSRWLWHKWDDTVTRMKPLLKTILKYGLWTRLQSAHSPDRLYRGPLHFLHLRPYTSFVSHSSVPLHVAPHPAGPPPAASFGAATGAFAARRTSPSTHPQQATPPPPPLSTVEPLPPSPPSISRVPVNPHPTTGEHQDTRAHHCRTQHVPDSLPPR